MALARRKLEGSLTDWALAAAGLLSMGFAWWWPGSLTCAALAWLSSFFLCSYCLREGGYLKLWLCGAALQMTGFYWLFKTISHFGGFGILPALAIFGLFVLYSALQFPLFLFVRRRLPAALDHAALRSALAWALVEYLPLRIFPWYAGHTQLAFAPLAQSADIAGAIGVSFLMFWVCESLARIVFMKEKGRALIFSAAALALALAYGMNRLSYFAAPQSAPVKVAVVQANISIAEKHNQRFIEANLQRYLQLSRPIAAPDRLIIWPESVITDPLPLGAGHAALKSALAPLLELLAPMITGALTADYSRRTYHNSAVALYADGHVAAPYHKRILMPFGEYMPFSRAAPWLKKVFETPDFEPGIAANVFEFELAPGTEQADRIKVAANVCYEDIVGSLARDATREGAQLLVNHTNDAWYGDTVAPYQHHLIASFRAIENRRYFIRSTNTGYTGIIDPTGKTIAGLPVFSEGVLTASVRPHSELSPYTACIGDSPWLLLTIGLAFTLAVRAVLARNRKA